jgi:hypothetical protein
MSSALYISQGQHVIVETQRLSAIELVLYSGDHSQTEIKHPAASGNHVGLQTPTQPHVYIYLAYKVLGKLKFGTVFFDGRRRGVT